MAEKKKYQIRVQNELVPVTEEVYLTYYRMKRRELHLQEKDAKHGVFFYSALDTKETNGEDAIPDLISPRVEDIVVDKLIAEKLHECLAQLPKEEQELIFSLFFQNKSEHQLAAETGIPRMTIHNRKKRILARLKNFWKTKNNLVQPPHETGLVVRGFFIPRMFFENFISDNLNTLADGALKGKATSGDAPRPPIGF